MTQKLYTLSRIAVHLQRPFLMIEQVAEQLGIEPVLQLNDQVYYSPDAENAIDNCIRQRQIDAIQKGKK